MLPKSWQNKCETVKRTTKGNATRDKGEKCEDGIQNTKQPLLKAKGRRVEKKAMLKLQTANKIAGEMAINTVGHGQAKGPLFATVDQLVGQNWQQPQNKQQQQQQQK